MNAQTKIVAADGWIAHDGGECPLPYETLIHVRFRNGIEDRKAHFAGFWATGLRDAWRHQGPRDWHIVAYRLVPVAPVINLPARHDRIAAERAALRSVAA
ncbi:hypothetical protein HY78_08510 [Rhizorhabdus wittichii DC-6]|nr:hypothetical protein HY78_08510 [Rhizorhabdus wittichii DC-6]